MAAILALLLMGSTAVFAASYSFVFDDANTSRDSGVVYKSDVTTAATVTQTGSSPGVYSVGYRIMYCPTGIAVNMSANEIVLACTNRSTTLIPYYNGNGDLTGECKLRGRYIGQANNSVTVNGTWNP
ncbi:MAG: hypothetical protein IJ468_00940 [Lachnospiraceae bacterium]|nr:hypothetical protein [Lachnospiraceae bacterium]